MKTYLIPLFFFFCSYIGVAQNIEIKNEIAYVNGKAYVKVEKKSNRKFMIYDAKTNEKLLKATIDKTLSINGKYDIYSLKLRFTSIDKKVIIQDRIIKSQKDIVQFLHEERLFSYNGKPNPDKLLDQYKRLSAIGKCDELLENDFSRIVNDQFISVVKNDTVMINEIKYLCVFSALYIQKAMFDRYGKWHKAVKPSPTSRNPNLIWNNIQLFKNIDKKFTVIARGYEGRGNIYTSIIVLDENGNDMLAESSPDSFRIMEQFGGFIKNNSLNQKFYEAYWTTFDPERWERIKESMKHN